jgi:hypothetical protein
MVVAPFSSTTLGFYLPPESVAQIVDTDGHTVCVLGYIVNVNGKDHPLFFTVELDGMLAYWQALDKFDPQRFHTFSDYTNSGGFAALEKKYINGYNGFVGFSVFTTVNPPINDAAFKADPKLAMQMGYRVDEKLYEIWYESKDNGGSGVPYGTANAWANIDISFPEATQDEAWQYLSSNFLGCLSLGWQ